jgi:hypothetical protein
MSVRKAAVCLCRRVCAMALASGLLATGTAGAQTTVALPDTGQATTLTAAVAEQARVTVPASISFSVSDVNASTTQGSVAIAVQNIVLGTATKQLRISLSGNAASFTPPVAGATTWSASDVSWTAGPGGGPNAWQNAIGSAGTLSSVAFNTVATCDPDATSCSIAKLSFTLAAKPTVKRSGAHTLTVTWRFESIGT